MDMHRVVMRKAPFEPAFPPRPVKRDRPARARRGSWPGQRRDKVPRGMFFACILRLNPMGSGGVRGPIAVLEKLIHGQLVPARSAPVNAHARRFSTIHEPAPIPSQLADIVNEHAISA
ncbi:hypothetical protein GCM10010990_04460 [Croceicoccus mobilis]|uniref:Uncharacterized protein n=1 Tax=Croceicoccus mobilis TaxID=1703339 RepID=A0A916YRN6_9SPHN|nr:hypothetical protein GCM10010990_04460 [Croceicoccus mobilis]